MKLTKVTIKRLNAHSNIMKPRYNPAIYIIAEILCSSAIILGDSGNYELNEGDPLCEPLIYNDGKREFISGQTHGEYEKSIVRGLTTRYPCWISGTFTNGLNGVQIYEVNKLVKAILDNQEGKIKMENNKKSSLRIYAAIGHFKDSENITSIASIQTTKRDFEQECRGNTFVPYIVITEKMFQKLKDCKDSWEIYNIVKKMTSNYRVLDHVVDYLEQCMDIIMQQIETARKELDVP